MATDSKTKLLKQVRQRKYLNKDFNALRADLLEYARIHYGDKVQDFSESSLGGVFLDFAAYVGDVHSFYLDHQFSELFASTAIENSNIERALREAGVTIVGNSPSVSNVFFFIEVPAEKRGTEYVPVPAAVPIILQDTIVTADNGVQFTLTEDIDFSELNEDGKFLADIKVSSSNSDGSPATFIMIRPGICISGKIANESINISSTFKPFRRVVLSNTDITEIISVADSLGNTYYEVGSLVQDTVYKRIPNVDSDNKLVKETLEVIPAPYRYTMTTEPNSRLVTLTFGGGNAQTLDDDIIPDPSEFAVPLYGKKTFKRFSIDPNRLLKTRTLGIAAIDTTLRITYRYGGGLNHNVPSNTIVNITSLQMKFPYGPTAVLAAQVRASTEATNPEPSSGGENAPTLDDLKDSIPSARNSQARLVSKEDLLARVYTMPSNFGRVYRAGIRPSQNNPLAAELYIISRDNEKKLIHSPDTLKKNLAKYLNEYRLVSDAIDILDSRVINFGLDFQIVIDTNFNKKGVIQLVIKRLKSFLSISNFQIDQPIVYSDISNIIFNNPGVIAINDVKIKNLNGTVSNRVYSNETHDIKSNTIKGMLIGPPGSIFELRYPNFDIQGAAV